MQAKATDATLGRGRPRCDEPTTRRRWRPMLAVRGDDGVVTRRSARRSPVGGRDVRDAVIGLFALGAALLLASWLLPGLTVSPWWAAVVLAAVVAVADAVLRPVLRVFAGRVGAVAALVL